MKKSFLLILLLTLGQISTFAQAPQSFKYQAVVREANGALMPNRSVSLRISILKSDVGGPVIYAESHKTTTTETGTINLEIGNGTILSGNFSEINWGSDSHFAKVEIDKNGGASFEQVGIAQLLSVPYALYSEKSGDDDWDNVASGITYIEGNVGIGKVNPTFDLDVSGSVNASSFLLNGTPFSGLTWLTGFNSIHYNSGNVGIGTAAPSVKLEINGQNDLNLLNLRTENNSLGINSFVSSNTDFHGSALIGRRSRGTYESPQTVLQGDRIGGIYGSLYAGGGYQNSSAIHFYVGPSPGVGSYPSNIRFETTNIGETTRVERMRISENGNIEVKTGDIYLESIDSGIIMRSPNGQCWRLTVDNSGLPIFATLTCPN